MRCWSGPRADERAHSQSGGNWRCFRKLPPLAPFVGRTPSSGHLGAQKGRRGRRPAIQGDRPTFGIARFLALFVGRTPSSDRWSGHLRAQKGRRGRRPRSRGIAPHLASLGFSRCLWGGRPRPRRTPGPATCGHRRGRRGRRPRSRGIAPQLPSLSGGLRPWCSGRAMAEFSDAFPDGRGARGVGMPEQEILQLGRGGFPVAFSQRDLGQHQLRI
jgi:hypothetical protein